MPDTANGYYAHIGDDIFDTSLFDVNFLLRPSY